MTMRITVTTMIDAPHDVVWADVSDMASHAEWMADADRIEVVSDTARGVGTVLEVPTTIGPLHTTDRIIVTQWDEGRAIGVIHVGIVTGEGEFRIEPVGDRTRFVWDETLDLPLHLGGRIGEIVARPIIGAIWRGNLRRLSQRFPRGAG